MVFVVSVDFFVFGNFISYRMCGDWFDVLIYFVNCVFF